MIEYAKGKRGIIYREGNVCIKEKNPDAAVNTLENEANFLQVLNEKNIGPKFIKFENGKLFRDFVEGERIEEFLQKADKKDIINVLKDVLEQCRAMNERGVEKKELTKPYKDIIITKTKSDDVTSLRSKLPKQKTKSALPGDDPSGKAAPSNQETKVLKPELVYKPVLIDFERCRFTENPSNVTQFLQYIAMNKEVLEKKGLYIDKKELIKLGKEYKENPCEDSFERILEIFN